MKVRILYFVLGVAFSALLAAILLYFDLQHRLRDDVEKLYALAGIHTTVPTILTEKDLIGTWKRYGPYGDTTEIIRKANHTFTAVHHHEVSTTKSSGFWAYDQPDRAMFGAYAESDRAGGIYLRVVAPQSSSSFSDLYTEGFGALEEKQ